jgi:hypothetical protein
MKELEDKISEIILKDWNGKREKLSPLIAKEIKDIATSFAEWIKKEGYIYVGEHDYMYPDADGLIGGGYLFEEFIKERYKP